VDDEDLLYLGSSFLFPVFFVLVTPLSIPVVFYRRKCGPSPALFQGVHVYRLAPSPAAPRHSYINRHCLFVVRSPSVVSRFSDFLLPAPHLTLQCLFGSITPSPFCGSQVASYQAFSVFFSLFFENSFPLCEGNRAHWISLVGFYLRFQGFGVISPSSLQGVGVGGFSLGGCFFDVPPHGLGFSNKVVQTLLWMAG